MALEFLLIKKFRASYVADGNKWPNVICHCVPKAFSVQRPKGSDIHEWRRKWSKQESAHSIRLSDIKKKQKSCLLE